MSSIPGILKELCRLVEADHGNDSVEPTVEDGMAAKKLHDLMHDMLIGGSDVEVYLTLDSNEESCVDENDGLGCFLNNYFEDDETSYNRERHEFTLKQMKKIVDCYDKFRWARCHERFRRVRHRSYISRFRKYIFHEGNIRQKFANLHEQVWERFQTHLNNRVIVHDYDIKRWGFEYARTIGLTNFKASDKWVLLFKRKHKIVSRKITKFVTNFTIENPELLLAKAKSFTDEIRPTLQQYKPSHVLNSDQSGFNYLLKSTRMLTQKGEKVVLGQTQSNFKQTHSYTIQPLVAMSGQLVGRLYIVLQEVNGVFGPRVKEEVIQLVRKCKNVVVRCSKSGKMSKPLVKDWVEACLKPSLQDKCLLLLDSWKAQKCEELFEDLDEFECERRFIPENTTHICQPLDVYGFRQWKIFVRKITSHIDQSDQGNLSISSRSSIITMQSLAFNQFSSPRFRNMFKYGWFKSGYLTDSEQFQNANQIMFTPSMNLCCTEGCDSLQFIRCSHCEEYLCFEHFFVNFHYHEVSFPAE